MAKKIDAVKKTTTQKKNGKSKAKKELIKGLNKAPDAFPIVGIGASAGGYNAFSTILKYLPSETGLAYVFIVHLDPVHESHLTDLLSKDTKMPVKLITNNMTVLKDTVYIIPPNKAVVLKGRKLQLKARSHSDGPPMPINTFFHSLAAEEKNKAIAIILSGTGSDGTEGLRSVKAEGGVTFAQEEASAKYNSMPRSAVLSGDVDFVLPLERIADELVRIGSHPYMALSPKQEKEKVLQADEDELSQIFKKLRAFSGVDFTHYKSNTIRRRILRRMVLLKLDTLSEYVDYISDNKKEIGELYQDMLINVTNFFRDPEIFKVLNKKIFPKIINNTKYDTTLRVWVPGCSTGEEPFSIAMCLLDYLGSKASNVPIQIFATDISDRAIEKARNGIYPESIVNDVPHRYLKNYFVKVDGGYQISKIIREMCVFARQDITKDPPFSKIDLISCRNLLIYLSPILQGKIIPIFHYALKPEGILLLGSSESVGSFADLFSLIDKKYKIYSRKNITYKPNYEFTYTVQNSDKNNAPPKIDSNLFSSLDIQKEVDKIALTKYSPPGLLLNDNLEIIQFRGNTSLYLEPSPGTASLNLFKMTKEGLTIELHAAIHRVKKEGKPVSIPNVRIKHNGSFRLVDIDIIPIKPVVGAKEIFYAVFFSEKTAKEEQVISEVHEEKKEDSNSTEEQRLRNELAVTREYLQSIIEDREATNEELRSALEEIQSSNEELQSTNEELETAKEELQSTNEELITVNEELETRNFELNQLNNDLVNLLGTVKYPTIMLDNNLRIRRFTTHAEKLWNLISSDLGRPISDLSPNIVVPNLKELVEEVLESLTSKEIDVKDKDGVWYSMRIRPYKTTENKIEGVVITIIDFEDIKRHIDTSKLAFDMAEAVIDVLKQPVCLLNNDLKIIKINESFVKAFDIEKNETQNNSILNILNNAWNTAALKKLFNEITTYHSDFENFEAEIKSAAGSRKKIFINAMPFSIKDSKTNYILLEVTGISEK